MKDRSTLSWVAYFFEVILCELITMIVFKNIWFRCLPETTYSQSSWMLWGMLAASAVLGSIVFRYRKTGWTVFVAVVFPYGLFTIMAYNHIVSELIRIALSVGVGLSVMCTIWLVGRKINHPKFSAKIIKNRLYKCFCVSQSILALSLTVIMGCIGFRGFFGNGLFVANVSPTVGSTDHPQIISQNMDTILLLQEDKWRKLTNSEKLDILQTVANIEGSSLGLPIELNVTTDNLREGTLANYSDRTRTIRIDLSHLESDSGYSVLNSCCHEAYHGYQYRMVDAYCSADKNIKELKLYEPAVQYMQEFGVYKDGRHDFEAYYNQKCETDARNYAKKQVKKYRDKIKEYQKKQVTG